jgi:hypothetical protein
MRIEEDQRTRGYRVTQGGAQVNGFQVFVAVQQRGILLQAGFGHILSTDSMRGASEGSGEAALLAGSSSRFRAARLLRIRVAIFAVVMPVILDCWICHATAPLIATAPPNIGRLHRWAD